MTTDNENKVTETLDSANSGKVVVEKFARLIIRAKGNGEVNKIHPSVFAHQFEEFIRNDGEFQIEKVAEWETEAARIMALVTANDETMRNLATNLKFAEIAPIAIENSKLRIARNDELLKAEYAHAHFSLVSFEVEKGTRGRSLPVGCIEVESVRLYAFDTAENSNAFVATLADKKFKIVDPMNVIVYPTKRAVKIAESTVKID